MLGLSRFQPTHQAEVMKMSKMNLASKRRVMTTRAAATATIAVSHLLNAILVCSLRFLKPFNYRQKIFQKLRALAGAWKNALPAAPLLSSCGLQPRKKIWLRRLRQKNETVRTPVGNPQKFAFSWCGPLQALCTLAQKASTYLTALGAPSRAYGIHLRGRPAQKTSSATQIFMERHTAANCRFACPSFHLCQISVLSFSLAHLL